MTKQAQLPHFPANAKSLQDGRRIATMAITPTIAECWLGRNTRNRPLSIVRAKQLADEMTAGKWHDSVDPIRFDGDAILMSGQHRLKAVVLSGHTIQESVETNCPESMRLVIDSGWRRSASQNLRIAGEKYAYDIPATLGHIERLLTRRYDSRDFTPIKIQHLLAEHPGVRESIATCYAADLSISRAGLAAFHYLLAPVTGGQAFMERIISQAGHEVGDPEHGLLRSLRAFPKGKKQGRDVREKQFRMFIKAWNLLYDGSRPKYLARGIDLQKNELSGPLPKLKGVKYPEQS